MSTNDGALTPAVKASIDAKSYEALLSLWRFAPVGHPMFRGETGAYYQQRMRELREQGADHVGASKAIGWDDND